MSSDKQYSGNPYQTPVTLRTNRQTTANAQRPRLPVLDNEEDENPDAWTMPKPHTSSIKQTAYLDRRNPKKTKQVRQRTVDRYTLMIIVGLALIVMILGWFVFTLVADWWTNTTDDWKYGNPRTYQIDQFVGQGDSPDHPDHFIVVNTHGQVIVIQLNPQHPELNHIYGITTASDPKTPVSLLFRPTGTTWAMYVVVGDTNPYSVEYVSNGKQFVPASH
ncbi:MAG TPA: hypothetical protein VIZ18_13000 [Ktedonobacteraceae bacterium]